MKNPIKYVSANIAHIFPGDTILKVDCSAQATALFFPYPSSSYDGVVTVKKVDSGSNTVTIFPHGGETIDGAASVTLVYEGDYKTFAPVSGGFSVVDAYTPRPALVSPTITGTATKITPIAATGALSISDVCKDGETIAIGTKKYEFCADAAQTLTAGSHYAIDIEAYTTKSHNTLTLDTNPTATNTMTIGTTEYTFVSAEDFDTALEIPIGDAVADTQANVIAAIMGTDGVNAAHTLVTIGAFADNVATITAKTGGTAGDTIATTETFTAETNIFSGETLGSGADCSAANAVTAIVAAVTANDENVTAAAGAGNTVDFTSKIAGAAGNAIATTETMTNGAFGAATLVGGADIGLATPIFTNPIFEMTVNSHDYDSGVIDWTLTAAEQLKPYHKVVSAGGAVNAIIPLTPAIPYTFINASGAALTVKGASGNGIAITNGKTAVVMADGTNVIRITADA
jgi:hypothetical protein